MIAGWDGPKFSETGREVSQPRQDQAKSRRIPKRHRKARVPREEARPGALGVGVYDRCLGLASEKVRGIAF